MRRENPQQGLAEKQKARLPETGASHKYLIYKPLQIPSPLAYRQIGWCTSRLWNKGRCPELYSS